MILKSYFPLIVACYVVAVGLFFLSTVVIENALITPDPGGRPVLLLSLIHISEPTRPTT